MNQEKSAVQSDIAAMLGTSSQGDSNANDADELAQNPGEDSEEVEGIEDQETKSSEREEAGAGEEEESQEAGETSTASELASLREQMQLLMDEIRNIKKTDEPEEDKPEDLPELDFVGDSDLDDVMSDPVKVNELLKRTADHAYNKAIEQTIRIIPGIVAKLVRSAVEDQTAAVEFYKANDDLIPHKPSVARIYTKLLQENPSKNPYEILKDLAPIVRKQLKLPPRGQKQNFQQLQGQKKPKFAPGSSAAPRGQQGQPIKSDKQKIADDVKKMLKV